MKCDFRVIRTFVGARRVLAAIFVCSAVLAQGVEDLTVDGRLLEILHRRGVISGTEYAELKQLERELVVASDLERRIDAQVEEMVARASQDALKVSHKPGSGISFATADGNFSMTIGVKVQARFTYDALDRSTVLPAGSKAGDDRLDFSVPRARLILRGTAFDPHLRYQVSMDMGGDQSRPATGSAFGGVSFASSGSVNANRLTELKDAFVDWQVGNSRAFNVRAGQFKVQYSREAQNPVTELAFVDRNPGSVVFAPSRSTGISLWGTFGGAKGDAIEYYASAMNGPNVTGTAYLEGENTANDDDGLLWNARVAWNPLGAIPNQHLDLRPDAERNKLLIGLGANAWYHTDDNRRADGDSFDDTSFGFDAAAMWSGFYATAEAHWRSDAQRNGAIGAPPISFANPDIESFGYFGQLNYCIVPTKFDIGVRYAELSSNGVLATSNSAATASREYLLVAGYFVNGHANKLQADFGRVESHFLASAANLDEWRLRVQFTVSF